MRRTTSESKLSQIKLSLYKRGPNRYATRNHVLVLASTFCCNRAVQKICERFRELRFGSNSENRVIPLVHTGGCCDVGFDEALVEGALIRMAANPNFGGVLLVHLGCGEFCSTCGAQGAPQKNGRLIQALRKSGHVDEVVIQGRGFSSAVDQGIDKVDRFVTRLKDMERELVEFKIGIFAGVMNGSSDMTSPVANAAVGSFIDELVLDYGRAACGQVVEMLGAESEILSRAIDDRVKWEARRILTAHAEQRAAAEHEGVETEPTSGNKDGGISTLSEKSLGTVKKIGSSGKIVEVIPFGKKASTRDGLHIINTSGQDVLSLSGLCAAGCNLILFTTGRGAPTGAPGVPTIKVTANQATHKNLEDIVDLYIPLEQVIRDGRTLSDVALEIIGGYCAQVANGTELTCAEKNEQYDFQVMKFLPTA